MKPRHIGIILWLLILSLGLYLSIFEKNFIRLQLAGAFSVSVFFAYAVYLALGSLRGFTLLPATPLIVLGLLFFRPVPLFFLTVAGILISSTTVYFFSEYLGLKEVFERTYPRQIARIRRVMQRYELPIVIGWSFFPLAPTDVICYVCGILNIDFKKFILGILIGEGVCCALYIFLGASVVNFLRL